jgi:hypothetical protein
LQLVNKHFKEEMKSNSQSSTVSSRYRAEVTPIVSVGFKVMKILKQPLYQMNKK